MSGDRAQEIQEVAQLYGSPTALGSVPTDPGTYLHMTKQPRPRTRRRRRGMRTWHDGEAKVSERRYIRQDPGEAGEGKAEEEEGEESSRHGEGRWVNARGAELIRVKFISKMKVIKYCASAPRPVRVA